MSFNFWCHNQSLNFGVVGGEMRNGYGEKRVTRQLYFVFFTSNIDSFHLFIVVLTAYFLVTILVKKILYLYVVKRTKCMTLTRGQIR